MKIDFFKNGRDPDHINEIGVKWWRQKTHLNNAKAEILEANGFSCWYTEDKTGDDRNHIIIRNDEIIKVEKGLESIATYMDVMWLVHCT